MKSRTPNTDIWICHLRPVAGCNYESALEDCKEAACYTNEAARFRFPVSRRTLRSILADYAGTPARELRFRKGRYGKLYLHGQRVPRVHFNISHSRDRLLIAVSHSGPVGVDLEHLRPIDAGWLARNWFSQAERREWWRVAAPSRLEAFFHGWARKEAFLKATGFGMAMPFDSFSVSLDPHRAELLEVRGVRPRHWRLSRIDAGPECAPAVVTFGDPGILQIREEA